MALTTKTRKNLTGEYLLAEQGMISREAITLAVLTAALSAGQVLGKVALASGAPTSAAMGANTGNGTMGAVSLLSIATQVGLHTVEYLTATTFRVTAPDGDTADGSNGVAFSALGIGFTATTGGTPMIAGDGFDITVVGAPGKPTATAAAQAGNTGNSTLSAITTVGYAAMAGKYTLTIIEPGANVGAFVLENPMGQTVGHGNVASAFTGGGLSFTLADGATDFVASDQFYITVAAGVGTYKARDPSAVDGSAVAAGILYAAAPISTVVQDAVMHARLCEVDSESLVGADAQAVIELAALNIIVR